MTLFQHSPRLIIASRVADATYDAMWRAAAEAFLASCFTPRVEYQTIRELRAVFDAINARYQPL